MNVNHYRGDRIEEPVQGYPGIYKVSHWHERKQQYVDPRSMRDSRAKPFRAVKRVKSLGQWVKQQAKFATLEEAREWKEQTTAPVVKKTVSHYSFGQLVADWQEWSKNYYAPSTIEQYAKEVRHMRFLTDIPVEDLQAEDIDTWLKHVIHPSYPKPTGRRSFEREVATLMTILNWYRERKSSRYQHPILKRHWHDAAYSQEPRKKKLPLTEEELGKVLNWLKTHSQRQVYYYLAAFQALSGPRIGEACGLKWTDIDFHNSQYTIERIVWWEFAAPRTPRLRNGTKTGEIRVVKMCARLVAVLKEWKMCGTQGPFVFHSNGDLMHYAAVQNGYNKAFKALGLPHRSTHVFRHTFATLHADQTKDIRATQGALGHRDLRTTQHYANVSILTQERALADFQFGKLEEGQNPCPPNVPQTPGQVIPLKMKVLSCPPKSPK